jgi:16S rRNA (adenine1518-N6/adenine1519-N6)-dimethyltransferase
LRKRFGQHFLVDEGTIAAIVHCIAPQPGQTMVEIGPGGGAMTWPLLQALGRLTAIELDRDRIAPLTARARDHGDLTLVVADVLNVSFQALAPPEGRLRVVGNLPYNITTPLLFHLLAAVSVIADMVFLVQREVALRMAAVPGSKAYGRLSVMLQAECAVEVLLAVGPEVFRPPPKVHSALVRLVPRVPARAITNQGTFAAVVKAAFGQRRKTLRNALGGMVNEAAFAATGVDPGLRAEALSVADFIRLANHLAEQPTPHSSA